MHAELVTIINDAIFRAVVGVSKYHFFDRKLTTQELKDQENQNKDSFDLDMLRTRHIRSLDTEDISNEEYVERVKKQFDGLPIEPSLKSAIRAFCHQNGLTNPTYYVLEGLLRVLKYNVTQKEIFFDIHVLDANNIEIRLLVNVSGLMGAEMLAHPDGDPLLAIEAIYTFSAEKKDLLEIKSKSFRIYSEEQEDEALEEKMAKIRKQVSTLADVFRTPEPYFQGLTSQANYTLPASLNAATSALVLQYVLSFDLTEAQFTCLLANSKLNQFREDLNYKDKKICCVKGECHPSHAKCEMNFHECHELKFVNLKVSPQKQHANQISKISFADCPKLQLDQCRITCEHKLSVSLHAHQHITAADVLAFAFLNPNVTYIQYSGGIAWHWLSDEGLCKEKIMAAMHFLLSTEQKNYCIALIKQHLDPKSIKHFEKELSIYSDVNNRATQQALRGLIHPFNRSNTLTLANPMLNDEALGVLATFAHMTDLNLDNLSELVLPQLGALPELITLSMQECRNLIGVKGLQAPKLTRIDLKGSHHFRLNYLLAMVEQCNKKLNELTLRLQGCNKVSCGFVNQDGTLYKVTARDIEATPALLSHVSDKLSSQQEPLQIQPLANLNLVSSLRQFDHEQLQAAFAHFSNEQNRQVPHDFLTALDKTHGGDIAKMSAELAAMIVLDKSASSFDSTDYQKGILSAEHQDIISYLVYCIILRKPLVFDTSKLLTQFLSGYLASIYDFNKDRLLTDDQFMIFILRVYNRLFIPAAGTSHIVPLLLALTEDLENASASEITGRARLTFLMTVTLLQKNNDQIQAIADYVAPFFNSRQLTKLCTLYWLGDWDANKETIKPYAPGMKLMAALLTHVQSANLLFTEFAALTKQLPYPKANEMLYVALDYLFAFNKQQFKEWHPIQQRVFREQLKTTEELPRFWRKSDVRRVTYAPIDPSAVDHPIIGAKK